VRTTAPQSDTASLPPAPPVTPEMPSALVGTVSGALDLISSCL